MVNVINILSLSLIRDPEGLTTVSEAERPLQSITIFCIFFRLT